LVQGVPQVINHVLDILDRFPQGRGLRGSKRMGGRRHRLCGWYAWNSRRDRGLLPESGHGLLGVFLFLFDLVLQDFGVLGNIGRFRMWGEDTFFVVTEGFWFSRLGLGQG
jgi:hypothetical protein